MVDQEREGKLWHEEGKYYTRLYLDMATARKWKRFDIAGDFIIVEQFNTSVEPKIRLNEKESPDISLKYIRQISSPFSRFYIYNDAGSSGENIVLLIGGEASFSAVGLRTVQVDQSKTYAWDGSNWKQVLCDSSGKI